MTDFGNNSFDDKYEDDKIKDDCDDAEEEEYDDDEEYDEDDESIDPDILLIVEAIANNWDYVFNMIDSGANVNTQEPIGGATLLLVASQRGDVSIIKRLIELGADVNITNQNGGTSLLALCNKGNIPGVRCLIEAGADVNIADKDGITPLFAAADKLNTEMMRILLEAGADPSRETNNETTPLQVAFVEKNQEMYDLLMEFGVKPINQYNALGRLFKQFIGECDYQWFRHCVDQDCYELSHSMFNIMVIQPTAGMPDLRFLKALADTGWSLHSSTVEGDTLMHIAARAGELETVKYLESKGLSLETRNNHGETAVHSAVKSGFWYIFDYARQKGFDAHELDSAPKDQPLDSTLLHCAAEGGNTDIVAYLINYGYDVNKFNSDGYTPLMYAAKNHHLKVVDMLIEAGADVNARKKLGINDMNQDKQDNVINIGHNQSIRISMKGPAGWGARLDKTGMTPLHLAIDTWQADKSIEDRPKPYTEVEFEKGVDTPETYAQKIAEVKNKYWDSMAEVARQFSDGPKIANNDPMVWMETVEHLIAAGARLNIACRQGNTPLLRAVEKGNYSLVKILVEKGANTSICNAKKQTPLQVARTKTNKEITILLARQPKKKVSLPAHEDRYDPSLCEPDPLEKERREQERREQERREQERNEGRQKQSQLERDALGALLAGMIRVKELSNAPQNGKGNGDLERFLDQIDRCVEEAQRRMAEKEKNKSEQIEDNGFDDDENDEDTL